MKTVTMNRVCIEKKIRKDDRVFCEHTPVFESTDMMLAMMVATSCKKFHNHVVVEGYSLDGTDFYGEVDV